MCDETVKKYCRRFVIGDIHGCYYTLERLLMQKLRISKMDELYFVGDFIDRGPKSKEVIDLLLSLKEEGFSINPVMGNHESLLISHYYGTEIKDWKRNGCDATFRSFGINSIYELENKYLEFFLNLPYYIELEDFIICHAGMNFDEPNPFEEHFSMLWTRDDFVDLKKTGGRRLICGHTPHTLEQIQLSLNSNKIQLDCGCVYLGRHPGVGFLCALELKSMELHYEQNCE
ncbi:MAG: serine/threonine protein phosphatase [Ignavibacteriae bacterium]|nr:serine/threonine protein phosphatase [Ignavibacteriota bacterium]